MAKTAKLIMITPDNNNKFYNMFDNENGTFSIEFGRVGAAPQKKTYSSASWMAKYNEKIKKGYKDITGLYVEEENKSVGFADIADFKISQLVSKLQAYAKKQVATFYNITADKVTQKQVNEAQQLLNALVGLTGVDEINKYLLELYAVIPRKMSNVRQHLLDSFDSSQLNKMLSVEQDLLDTMAQQVNQVEITKDNHDASVTLLDAMGIEITNVTLTEVGTIKQKLQNLSDKYANAYKVVNKKTQKRFDDHVASVSNKKCDLFFHGSRNENWLPILESGLLLRPTGAVITGKMFGYGTYYADKAQKSYGYTSGRNSYWAGGTSDEAYMALFDVHLGNPLHIKRHEHWCSSLDLVKLKARGSYDSVFAEGGYDLRNNEFIVYTEQQSTIKYLIQLRG